MKAVLVGVVMMLPLFAGCLDAISGNDEPDRPIAPADVGHDPQEIAVTGVQIHELDIDAGDVSLSSLIYEPLTTDATADGDVATWPVVVLLHGWGFPKEMYTNAPIPGDNGLPVPNVDLMQGFAEGGLLTVAYDARGWYQSTGTTTVAGLAEMNDLRAVIDYVNENFPTNGLVGVAGVSYGGGQALQAWKAFDDVVTVVPHQGWVDLFNGLAPGNAMKLEWTAFLGAASAPGTKGVGTSQDLASWGATLATRQDAAAVDAVHGQMDQRSLLDASGVNKPLLICQGLQESLFPQAHQAWQTADGFTVAHYYQGGHMAMDAECWSKTKLWFQFFLGGYDTGVDSWDAVTTVDHSGDGALTGYTASRIQEIDYREFFLHDNQMVESAAPNRTFTIEQRGVANPLHEPQGVWDAIGQPYQAVPAQMRQDPSAVFFTSAPMSLSTTLLGAPEIRLFNPGDDTPFQVVATLYHDGDDGLRMLGRTATSPLTAEHMTDGWIAMELPWMKVDLAPGDSIVLKLASNDETAFVPLMANYAAEFMGDSTISLPFFAPSGSSQ